MQCHRVAPLLLSGLLLPWVPACGDDGGEDAAGTSGAASSGGAEESSSGGNTPDTDTTTDGDTETDGGTDTGVEPDPTIAGCGDMAGLLEGAFWPAPGYCSAHPWQSPRPFPSQGTVGWTYNPGGDLEVVQSPVVADDGSIYVTVKTDTTPVHLVKLDPDGQEVWSVTTTNTGYQGESGSPVLTAAGLIVFANHEEVFAVDANGQEAWTVPLDGQLANGHLSVGADGTVYAGAGDLVAIGSEGNVRWRGGEEGVYILATAVDADGSIYAFGDDELYDEGYLFKFNPDGSEEWRVPSFGDAGGPYVAPMVASNGDVVVSIYGGTYVFDSDGTYNWGYPAMAGSFLEPASNTLLPDERIVVSAYHSAIGDYTTAVVNSGGVGQGVEGCFQVVLSDPEGSLLCRATEGGIRAVGPTSWHINTPTPEVVRAISGAAMGEETLYVAAGGVLVAIVE